jgi:hypothetical protein
MYGVVSWLSLMTCCMSIGSSCNMGVEFEMVNTEPACLAARIFARVYGS